VLRLPSLAADRHNIVNVLIIFFSPVVTVRMRQYPVPVQNFSPKKVLTLWAGVVKTAE
jgi:hypothetical protein